MQPLSVHTYPETPLSSCLTIMCPFCVPSSTHFGYRPRLYWFLTWPHAHLAKSSYREVYMERKNMEQASFREWKERREKKIFLVFAALLRLQRVRHHDIKDRKDPLQLNFRDIYVLPLLPSSPCPPAVLSKSPPVLRVTLVMGGYTTSSTGTMGTERGKDTEHHCRLPTRRRVLLHFLQAESNAMERWLI